MSGWCKNTVTSWRSAEVESGWTIAEAPDENNDGHFDEEAYPAFFDAVVENSCIASRFVPCIDERGDGVVGINLYGRRKSKIDPSSRKRIPSNPFDFAAGSTLRLLCL